MTAVAQPSTRPGKRYRATPAPLRPGEAVPADRPRPAAPVPVPPLEGPARVPPGEGHAAEPAVRTPVRSFRLIAMVALVFGTLLSALEWGGPSSPSELPATTSVVQVGAGETLWDVARRVAPHADQQAVVDRIRTLNGLVGSAVQPGQQLRVPDGR
jgi:LysM repeat protein